MSWSAGDHRDPGCASHSGPAVSHVNSRRLVPSVVDLQPPTVSFAEDFVQMVADKREDVARPQDS